jgi:putative salt-induced outer membrane protein YdiY
LGRTKKFNDKWIELGVNVKAVLGVVAVFFGSIVSSFVIADVVVMNNGDRLTGKLETIEGGLVYLTTEYAGTVPVQLSAVASMTTDEAFDVRVDGAELSGTFQTSGDSTMVGDIPVEIASIGRAGQDNVAEADLGTDWSSRADVSVVISNGNSDTESLNTLIESVLKKDKVQHAVSLLISREEAEEVTTKDQVDLDYGYKRFISEKWYAAGNAEYFKDELKDIDQRITLGAGMGYQFWDNSFGALSAELGVSAVSEEVGGENEDNPALRWGLEYKRYLLAKKLELFHRHSILVIPDADRGEVISASTGLRYALNDRVDAAARVDLNHETKPAPGNSKSDVTYTLGIGVKF